MRRLCVVESEKLDCITREHAVTLVLGYAGEDLIDHAAGIGPISRGVGKVASPHDPVDPDVVAKPNADRVPKKTPEILSQ